MVQAVNGNTKLQFAYDYMGRRVEKKVFDGDTVVRIIRQVWSRGDGLADVVVTEAGVTIQKKLQTEFLQIVF